MSADDVDRRCCASSRVFRPTRNQKRHHADVREREGDEHVDRVHDDQRVDVAAR